MKKLILAGFLSLAAVSASFGQAAEPTFVNNFVVSAPPMDPPQVDARDFINNNTFLIDLLSFSTRLSTLYATRNTCNYTNYGLMGSSTGFRFDTFDSATSRYYQAGSLYNEVGATIDCGGTNLPGIFSLVGTGPQCRVWATNIVNRGAIEMGINGLLSLQGKTVDLSGGSLNMEGFETGGTYRYWSGIFDGYWGAGQNDNWVPGPYSPAHYVTNRNYTYLQTALNVSAALPYQNVVTLGPSNQLIQTVFIQNTVDPAFTNSVYFDGANNIYVEWAWSWTNILNGAVQQDYLHFADGTFNITNQVFHTNGLASIQTAYRPTWIPTNYFHTMLGFTHATIGWPTAVATPPGMIFPLPTSRVTNDYASYMAIFEPFTLIPGEVPHQTFTNMGGGIEISAENFLDLTTSRIGALNYLSVSAPNHFATDDYTRILTEVGDFNLGCTNGLLTITNLMAPTCPRVNGAVYLYSARWTNVTTLNITNVYTVLLVDSQVRSASPTLLQNLTLHSTNVVITDVLNVVSNLNVDALNLTIATNGPDALAPAGQLNLLAGTILWTNSFPRLQNLTNYGGLVVSNAAFFGGMRTPPFYPATQVEPYWNFVNYGYNMNQGCYVWATNFENYGILNSGSGSITVQAISAGLSNGLAYAMPNGDISLSARDLRLNNQVLNAGRKLVLWATNVLDDGGATSSNAFTAGVGGFWLPNRPATARLLGTTLTETAPTSARVTCQWSGEDRGANASGYDNNAALGRLILRAGQGSVIKLQGTSGNNALYVDCLELGDYATNRDSGGNLSALQLVPGMKLYYADVRVNGMSMAEKLNHKNDGALNWVPAYAGAFSSTNLVYPDGSTNLLNLPLVESCNLDSDNDNIPNCMDPSPCLVPSMVRLTVESTKTRPNATRLTWDTIGFSANYLFYQTATGSTNWVLLTNFVCGPFNGQACVVDPVAATNRYYRVRVDVPQP